MENVSERLKGKKLFVSDQISCHNSRTAVSRYQTYMKSHGAVVTEQVSDADIILIDTCAFDRKAEDNSVNLIHSNQAAARPEAKVIVCGCMTAINPQRLVSEYRGDFFSPRDERHLATILNLDEEPPTAGAASVTGRFVGKKSPRNPSVLDWMAINYLISLQKLDNIVPLHRLPVFRHLLNRSGPLNPQTYTITISQGCHGNCSFCVIPLSKGKTRSLPMGLIVEKVRSSVQAGTRRILLTSEDVGAYGYDLKSSIVDLLARINEIPGDFDLYLNFFDPRWLKVYGEKLIDVLKAGRIKHLQFPMQSGSDSVLKRMYRAYRTADVLPAIYRIREQIKGIAITSQMITGFPGETEAEFEESRHLVKQNIFDHFEIFGFSSREGAAAEKMPGHLPQEIIDERFRILRRDVRISKMKILLGLRSPGLEKDKWLNMPLQMRTAQAEVGDNAAPGPVWQVDAHDGGHKHAAHKESVSV